MMKKHRLGKGALLMTLALAFTLSGCSGGASSGSSDSGPDASQSASASPSSEASASPTSSSFEDLSSPPADSSASADPSASSPSGGDPDSSAPQTSPVSSKAPTAYMGQVTALRLIDDQSGWTGGKGWIARTDDGGAHWKVQYSQGTNEIRQIFALNSKEVWATVDAGSSGSATLIRSADGGANWSKVGTVPNASFLHFTSGTTAFSGNAMTTDGGKSWTKLNVPANLVGDVYFHDKANGWAVQKGDGKFNFLHSSDAGKSWKVVFTRSSEAGLNGAVIRSTGKNDAWIELIGDSGMSQTSYSLFHTSDGGKSWLPSAWRNGAGSGPAPGFKMDDKSIPSDSSAGPGDIYVVNPQTVYMGRQCQACDHPNTVMETTDGGKSWTVRKEEFDGHGSQFIAATDAKHVWLIANENEASPVLYTSSDGGVHWKKVHTFEKAKAE